MNAGPHPHSFLIDFPLVSQRLQVGGDTVGVFQVQSV